MKEQPMPLTEFCSGFVAVGTSQPGIFDSIWWTRKNSVFSLGILLGPLTTDEPIIAQFASNLEKSSPEGSDPQWQ